ncbi:hypothetical protein ACFL2V_14660 [Pseudomonadota bacterium]
MKNSLNYSGFCRSAHSAKRKATDSNENASSRNEKITLLERTCPPFLMLSAAIRTNKTNA